MSLNQINLIIDDKKVVATSGDTIVAVANKNDIFIPTLCFNQRFNPSGECGICIVEIEGFNRPVRACSTLVQDGQVITTASDRIVALRKNILELLLSDHKGDCVAPCKRACPASTDCQGYVGLIANGAIKEATNLIMEKLPLPLSIGKVCPHPCEKECRRKLVDEPIAIASLKAYASSREQGNEGAGDREQGTGNEELLSNSRGGHFSPPAVGADAFGRPPCNTHATENHTVGECYKSVPRTTKKISVIGGGPGGLSAAYFLKKQGYCVTVYDAAPKMGGMLLYGVPEYRLPKQVLASEIDYIKSTGVEFKNNVSIGKDIALDDLVKNSDAVIVAIGAHKGTSLRCEGEDLDGVISGVDFLREVSGLGQSAFNTKYLPNIKGKKVAVVGGGDTAMDACRTAIRLGAKVVYNIYRRAKEQMPANLHEIIEAEEEGVVFKTLTNPIKIIGDREQGTGNREGQNVGAGPLNRPQVASVLLQKMQLV